MGPQDDLEQVSGTSKNNTGSLEHGNDGARDEKRECDQQFLRGSLLSAWP